MTDMANNIFGEPLEICSATPLTGFFRNGCCETGNQDAGTHTVCAIMTDEFLAYTKGAGNDLSTPKPEFLFPGLKSGDRWCLCVLRWLEAYKADVAPLIIPEATHEKTLEYVPMEELLKYAFRDKS
jgi:uncharacterized protein (DUF2237 family)